MPLRAIRSETSLNVQTDSWLQERNFLVLRACSKLIGGNTPCPAAGQSAAFMGPLVMSNPALQLYNNHAGWSSWELEAAVNLLHDLLRSCDGSTASIQGNLLPDSGLLFSHWAAGKELNWRREEVIRKDVPAVSWGGLLLCGTCWKISMCWRMRGIPAVQLQLTTQQLTYKTALTESFNALRSKFLSFEYMLSFPTLRPPESHRGRWRVQSLHDPKRHSRHTEGWKSDQHNESAKKYLWGNIHLPGHQSPSKQSRRNKLKLNSLFTWRTMNQITKHDFYDTKTNHEALLLLIIVNKWTAVFHCFW